MNKENAHEYLPLVQAIADGKIVQVLGGDGNWYNSKLINIPPRRYRIKPEPRTFKLYIIDTINGDPVLTTHPTIDHRWQQITVQEVLP